MHPVLGSVFILHFYKPLLNLLSLLIMRVESSILANLWLLLMCSHIQCSFQERLCFRCWHEEFSGQKEHEGLLVWKGETSSIAQTHSGPRHFLNISVLKLLAEHQLLFSEQYAWCSSVQIWHITGERELFLLWHEAYGTALKFKDQIMVVQWPPVRITLDVMVGASRTGAELLKGCANDRG